MHLLIVSDLDGTLVDSKRAISFSAAQTVLKFSDQRIEESYFYPFIGIPIRTVLMDLISEDLLDQSVDFFRSHLSEYGRNRTEVFPGVINSLKELKLMGINICVASNKVSKLARIVIDQQGLTPYIDDIYGSETFPPKPHPGMVLAAMKNFPAGATFMIGDRPEDVIAGKEAGAKTLLYSKEFLSLIEKNGLAPDKSVDSWTEILEFFEFLSGRSIN